MTAGFKQKISLKYNLLFLAFAPMVLFVGLFIYYSLSVNYKIDSSFAKVNESFDNLTDVLNLETSVKNLSQIAGVYVDSRDQIWGKEYDKTLIIFKDLLNKVSVSKNLDAGDKIMSEFKKTTSELQQTEALVMKKVKAGDIAGAKALFDSEYSNNFSLAGNLLYGFMDKESKLVTGEITASQNYLIMQEMSFTGFAVLFLFIIILIIINVFERQVLRPIEELAKMTKIIADGNMALRAEVINRDEIGRLAYNFNIMLDRLQSSHDLLNMTIGDLNQANEKLRKIDQMKSDFITVAAHQLRTPLTGIKWSLTAIMNGNMGSVQTEQAEYLKGAIESNQRMIDTVNQILKMKDIQTGSVEEIRTSVNLANLLNSILFDIYPQATQKEMKISLNIDQDSLPDINIDESEMRIVLQNLLENGIIYSKEKGQLDVSLKKDGGNVMFSVRDYGIGIPQDEGKNIFTKFFRTTNAIRHFANGSGLGLTIAKKIVDRYGGKIWFESEEGKGATFFVSLPLDNIS